MKTVEIMAPVGNWECLQAAIQGGCNAVYFGVEQLNMRARATNNFILAMKFILLILLLKLEVCLLAFQHYLV